MSFFPLNCPKGVSLGGVCIGNFHGMDSALPSIFTGPASIEGKRVGAVGYYIYESSLQCRRILGGRKLLVYVRTVVTTIFSVLSSFNMRLREQNIRAPEENACAAGYCECGLQSPPNKPAFFL